MPSWHIPLRLILIIHVGLGVPSRLFPNKSFVCISSFATNAVSPHYIGLQNESQNATLLESFVWNWILFYFTIVVAVSFC